MGVMSALVLFAVIWFMILFVTLPIRLQTQGDVGDIVPGTQAGAPVDPQLKKRFKIVTGVSAILWVIIAGIIMSGVITVMSDGVPVRMVDRVYSLDSNGVKIHDDAFKAFGSASDKLALWRCQPSLRTVTGFLALENCNQVIDSAKAHRIPGFNGGTTHVGQQEYVIQFAVTGMDICGLSVEHVQAGSGNFASLQGGNQGVIVNNSSP